METNARESVERHVRANPGVGTRRIARAVGLAESTVDYHLSRLRKEGKVTVERRGRELAWWPAGCGYCPVLRRAIPAFRNAEVAATARVLQETPAPSTRLAASAGLPLGSVRWAASVLEEAGIVRRTERGRLHLAEGASTCVAMAQAGTRCDRWGRCPLSTRR